MPIYDELNKITAERDQYVARRGIEYLTTMYQHLHPKGMVDLYFAKVDYNVQLAFATNRRNSAKEFDKLTGQLGTLNNPKLNWKLFKTNRLSKGEYWKYEKKLKRVKGDLEEYPEGKVVSGAL